MTIKLYSNHCPLCDIAKAKLDAKNIDYTLIDDVAWLTANGFDQMPVLEIDGNRIHGILDINTAIAALA